jgi:hypothetical protein
MHRLLVARRDVWLELGGCACLHAQRHPQNGYSCGTEVKP